MASKFHHTVTTMKPKKLERIGEGRFDAHLAMYENGIKAVLKRDHHRKAVFRQLPTSQAYLREAAFYRFSQLLFPGVVPETYITKFKGEECSAQMFVPGYHLREHDKKLFDTERDDFNENFRKIVYRSAPKEQWQRLALLDLVANSRDRHGKNVLMLPRFAAKIPIVAIDNGFSLGKTFRSYRNVFHRYLFNYRLHVPGLLKELEKIETRDVVEAICPLLKEVYADHVMRRIDWILEYPHRLPYRVISLGATRTVDFPSYEEYFKPTYRQLPEASIMVAA